jgi:hypothetical protein
MMTLMENTTFQDVVVSCGLLDCRLTASSDIDFALLPKD